MVVATGGSMACMNPAAYVAFKHWLAEQPEREALKRRRDARCRPMRCKPCWTTTCRSCDCKCGSQATQAVRH
ncbi:MAG: hypothetical protein ACWA6Y_06740 [Polaromonas sp.]